MKPKRNPDTAKKTRNKGRAPGQTSMTVSLPQELKDRIEHAALADNRKMSNWLVTKLTEWMENAGMKLI